MLKRFSLLAFILIASTPLQAQQAISPSRVFSTINGSVTAPVFTWTIEPALGIYRVGSGVIGVSGGVKLQSGSTLTSGIGVPTGGADGDFYFRSDTSDLYRRLSGTWATYGSGLAGTGTVTSVALTVPAIFTISGSPITTSGTIAVSLASQAANVVFASPNGSTGGPSFRKLLFGDWGSNACGAGQIPKYDGSLWQCADDAGASTGAPAAAQYLTLATDATLSNERVLTAATGITFTDAGAGSTLTVAPDGPNIPNLNASNLASGTVPAARGGAGTVTGIMQANGSGVVSAVTVGTGLTFSAGTLAASGGGGSPAGSTGDVQYNNAGAFGAIGPSTTGYVLTSNGSGTAPSFQAAGSGPVETHTASSSASLNFTTCLGSGTRYKVQIIGLVHTATDRLQLRFSLNGGTTYDNSGVYDITGYAERFSGGGGSLGGSSLGGMHFRAADITLAASGGWGGTLYIDNPSGSDYKFVHGELTWRESGALALEMFTGVYRNTSAVNAFQILPVSGGTLTAGSVRCSAEP